MLQVYQFSLIRQRSKLSFQRKYFHKQIMSLAWKHFYPKDLLFLFDNSKHQQCSDLCYPAGFYRKSLIFLKD